MSDDRTVPISTLFPVTVRVEKGICKEREYHFHQSFSIGRSPECELHFLDRSVSKTHATFQFEGMQWWIEDLGSRHGTFLNGARIQRAVVPDQARVELGSNGPVLHVTIEYPLEPPEPSPPSESTSSTVLQESPIPEEIEQTPISPVLQAIDQGEPSPSVEEGSSPEPPKEEISKPPPPISIPPSASPPSSPSQPTGGLTQIIAPILQRSSAGGAGQETMIIIKHAFRHFLKQRLRKYRMIVVAIAGLAILLGTVAWWQHLKIERMKSMASEIFYAMKKNELQLAELEDTVLQHLTPEQVEQMRKRQEKLRATQQKDEQEYEQFLDELGIYAKDMDVKDRSILRLARLFGECEVEMPEDFLEEVERYIQKWKSTERLPKAIQRAKGKGYDVIVAQAMLDQNMPPEFFYLALQESNFDIRAVGPKTRFGIAKGPWQFIPSTAVEYGLQTGPLVDIRKYDPRDERHDFKKATRAAARYLKAIYSTEAQASGLLVMASYNWGQTRVRKLIHQLPKNPKERNFWQLLKKHKIPKQTYDYVFYIFSAAVIAKNPELFGFDFENPLEGAMKEASM